MCGPLPRFQIPDLFRCFQIQQHLTLQEKKLSVTHILFLLLSFTNYMKSDFFLFCFAIRPGPVIYVRLIQMLCNLSLNSHDAPHPNFPPLLPQWKDADGCSHSYEWSQHYWLRLRVHSQTKKSELSKKLQTEDERHSLLAEFILATNTFFCPCVHIGDATMVAREGAFEMK